MCPLTTKTTENNVFPLHDDTTLPCPCCTTVWTHRGAGPSLSNTLLGYLDTQVSFPPRHSNMCQRPWHEGGSHEAAHCLTQQLPDTTSVLLHHNYCLHFESECSNHPHMLQVPHNLCSFSQPNSSIKGCDWRVNPLQFLAPRQSKQFRIAVTHDVLLRRWYLPFK